MAGRFGSHFRTVFLAALLQELSFSLMLHFSGYADRVTIVVRGEGLEATMSQYLVDQIAQTPNIELLTKTCVAAASGGERLEAITLADPDGCSNQRTVDAHLLFIFIGAVPRTDWLDGTVERDARGFLLTGPELVRDGRRPKGWRVDPRLWQRVVECALRLGYTETGEGADG